MSRTDLESNGGYGTRRRLAWVARHEAARELAGDANMAGPAIEPYLSLFRDALNANTATTRYSDTSAGFSWCCAFVFYCCRHAGFVIAPKPVQAHRWTLAAVPAWRNWAESDGTFLLGSSTVPEIGDIAIFNCADIGRPMDHMGIVVATDHGHFESAEGNNANRTGVFRRQPDMVEGYVRLRELA